MAEFYGRVKIGKSAGKSRIALFRKILVSAYHMLNRKQKYHWVEEELYSRKLKEFRNEMANINISAEEERKPA